MDIRGALSDALRSVVLFVPKALGFLAILVVGWLVARALRAVTDKVLERVGFDRAVERGGIRSALARSKYDASDLVAKLVYYAVMLFTLQLAFGIWGPNPVSTLLSAVITWLPQAFVAIVIVVVAAAVAQGVRDIIGNALGGLSYGRLLATATAWFIIGLGVIAALSQVGVATVVTVPILIAVLATVAGILIVGVGGGLVRPMQARWESALTRAADESKAIAEHARAYQAGQADAKAALARDEAARTERAALEEQAWAEHREWERAAASRRATATAVTTPTGGAVAGGTAAGAAGDETVRIVTGENPSVYPAPYQYPYPSTQPGGAATTQQLPPVDPPEREN